MRERERTSEREHAKEKQTEVIILFFSLYPHATRKFFSGMLGVSATYRSNNDITSFLQMARKIQAQTVEREALRISTLQSIGSICK